MTSTWKKLSSKEDCSVNFIQEKNDGLIECRYVRREDDYFIVYVSSHTGCKLACRFCHLTATGQTSFESVSYQEYVEQAEQVLSYYKSLNKPAQRVHFNFMARGEPLANETMQENGQSLIRRLFLMAQSYGVEGSSRISTIMPDLKGKSLRDIIGVDHVIPYYSLYSMDESFRKRWIPKGIPVSDALDVFKDWQTHSGEHVVIHGAFIEGENDSEKNIHKICDALIDKQITAKLNVVRYNPFNPEKHGTESSEKKITELYDIFVSRMKDARLLARGSRIVPRVGFDVKASCGMFVS